MPSMPDSCQSRSGQETMKTIATVVLGILLCSAVACGQATVDESLETAFIYVDAHTGSDTNPGTQQLPLKTIGVMVLKPGAVTVRL